MIEIYYAEIGDAGKLELRARGHAGAAGYGMDVICAAVSILLQTAGECLRELGTAEELRLMSGDARIVCPAGEQEKAALRVVRVGLRLIAERAPEFVRMEEIL